MNAGNSVIPHNRTHRADHKGAGMEEGAPEARLPDHGSVTS